MDCPKWKSKLSTSRRRAIKTTGGVIVSGCCMVGSVSAQSNSISASNDTAEIKLDNIDAKSYISSFQINSDNRFEIPKQIHPSYDLEHIETANFSNVAGGQWKGYTTQRIYNYSASGIDAAGGRLRINQTSILSPNDPIVITEFEITNESNESTTIKRPESHIHDGWIVSRMPPLNNPTGSYRYSINGNESHSFRNGSLWYVRELTADNPFITYYGDDRGITTKYLGGETEPIMTVTDATGDIPSMTTADVETASELPSIEDVSVNIDYDDVESISDIPISKRKASARQTPGFSIDLIDLCVEGFTIDSGETVSFATATIAHTGGSEAVARADELSQEVESLYNEMPALQEVSTNRGSSGLITRFQQSSDGGNLLPGIIGLGSVAALGVGAYRRFSGSRDDSIKQDRKPSSTASNSEPESTGEPAGTSIQNTVYEDYEEKNHLRSANYVEVKQAMEPSKQTDVALYSATANSSETVDSSVFTQLANGFDTWSSIDDHDHILAVHAHGDTPTPWAAVELADEYFNPIDLDHKSVATKRDIIVNLCNAVHEGHRYGLAHGNVNNSTFILNSGDKPTIKIGDWGITDAAINDDAEQQTDIEQVIEIAFELFSGESLSVNEPKSAPYPDNLEPVLEAAWRDDENYETVIHFRDAINKVI